MGWLIKMIDSNEYIGRNPTVEALYHGVKQSVVEIMSMVRQCEDKDEFFGNPEARQPRTKEFLNKILAH
jgi:hypothetical protein